MLPIPAKLLSLFLLAIIIGSSQCFTNVTNSTQDERSTGEDGAADSEHNDSTMISMDLFPKSPNGGSDNFYGRSADDNFYLPDTEKKQGKSPPRVKIGLEEKTPPPPTTTSTTTTTRAPRARLDNPAPPPPPNPAPAESSPPPMAHSLTIPDAIYSGEINTLGADCSVFGFDVERIQRMEYPGLVKQARLNKNSCNWQRRLECVPSYEGDLYNPKLEEVYPLAQVKGTCQCLISVGGDEAIYVLDYPQFPERGGKCFIPPHAGLASTCAYLDVYVPYGEIDEGSYQLRNILPASKLCSPNAECGRGVDFDGYRCQCMRDYEYDPKTGTCSRGALDRTDFQIFYLPLLTSVTLYLIFT